MFKIMLFWNTTRRCLVVNCQCSRINYCPHLQGKITDSKDTNLKSIESKFLKCILEDWTDFSQAIRKLLT